MTVTAITKDIDNCSLTIVSEYSAPADRVWQLWADPRLLERWWGPPTYPATVTEHNLEPGGVVSYYMTGPEGDRHYGGWQVLKVLPPELLELADYFADESGKRNPDLPQNHTTVRISGGGEGVTVMTIESRYPTQEALAQVLEMGMEEGIRLALGQTEALLEELSVE